jgi:hypothetical protein
MLITNLYFISRAAAQAPASGFEKVKPEPWAPISRHHGLGSARLSRAGLGRLRASSPSRHITTGPSVPRLFIQFALVILGSWYFLSSLYTSYPFHIPRLIDMRLSPLRKFAQDPLEEEENLPSHYALWSTASFVFILFSLVKLFRRIGVARWGLGRWMAYVQGLVHLFFVFGFAKHIGRIESVVGRCAGVFLGSLGCGYICAVGAAKGWTALEGILRGIHGQPKLDVEKRAEIKL